MGQAPELKHGPIGGRWAHLCIDMQVMFTDVTAWRTPWIPRVLPMVRQLVTADPARSIFTRFIPPRRPEDARGTWKRYWTVWSSMTREELPPDYLRLLPELEMFVPPARVIDKPGYSPWFGPLEGHLVEAGVDTLIVSGTETEMCVLAAVLGAVDRGYRVVIATDAVCSSADETHDAMMKIYHDRFTLQVETATVAQITATLSS